MLAVEGNSQQRVSAYPSRVRILAVAILVCAFSLRTAFILHQGIHPALTKTETVNVAVSLLQSRHFSDAFGPGTGPTAHLSPAYPIMLSLVFRLAGTGSQGEVAKRLFAALIASATYSLLPFIGLEAGLPFGVAICAGAVAAFAPLNFWPERSGDHESVMLGLMIALLFLHVARIWRCQRFSTESAVWLGLVAGIGSLVSPVIVPLFACWMACGLWVFRGPRFQYFQRATISFLLVILCLAPWLLRNYLTLGVPIWSRSNFWMEVNVSNNDFAEPNADKNVPAMIRMHPFGSDVQRAKYAAIGEIAYQHEQEKEATAWLAGHPGRFAELSATRFFYFWFPPMADRRIRIGMVLLTLTAFSGLTIVLLSRRSAVNWLFVSLFVVFPPVYYFVQAWSRYRYPIEWSIKLLAGVAIWAVVSRLLELIRVGRTPAFRSTSL
jgi:hypothetical protein